MSFTLEDAKALQHDFFKHWPKEQLQDIQTTKANVKDFVKGATLEESHSIGNITTMLYFDDVNHISYSVFIIDDKAQILKMTMKDK